MLGFVTPQETPGKSYPGNTTKNSSKSIVSQFDLSRILESK